MKYVAVLPWVDSEWKDACLATCKFDVHPIDNSVTNRGVPRSWNMGIDEMRRVDADWLIVMSAAVRFGPPGGMDFLQALEDRPDFHVIQALGVFGWHLIAFSRTAIETAGRFDENFYPGYFEDIDYSIRLQRGGIDPDLRGGFACDVMDAGMAHAIKWGVRAEHARLQQYFKLKWGSPPADRWDAYFPRPFARHPIKFWPPARYTKGVCNQPTGETL